MNFFSIPSVFSKKALSAALVLTSLPAGLLAFGPKQGAATLAEAAPGTPTPPDNGLAAAAAADADPTAAVEKTAAGAEPLKLSLNYVEYLDSKGKPVLDENQIKEVTQQINKLYAPCKIEFVAEEYHPVEPTKLGLEYNTQSMNELDPIRSQFSDPNSLVVINTGDWNHDSMGAANAWTAMPGGNPAGAVIEADAASFGGIVAHELGHYLGLDHVDDDSNMMNPIIYKTSTVIDSTQCDDMRDIAVSHWAAALR